MAKSYRNKPNRDKRNHTRKERKDNLKEVPHYVWEQIRTTMETPMKKVWHP